METAAAFFNHSLTAGQALSGTAASPMANSTPQTNSARGTDGSDGTSSGSATISANDFLTLLVTEMQNQDPTANTDPNEYINQLVQVNSLEQLININQTLSGDVGGTSSGSGSGKSAQVPAANGPVATSPQTAAARRSGAVPAAASPESDVPHAGTTGFNRAPGNLGVPGMNPAAQKVGHALDGRAHSSPEKGSAIALH